MSILIKGLKMPKENAICVVIFPDGRVTSQFGVSHLGTAFHVPPHGKLIEADKLGVRDAEKQAYEAYLRVKGEDFIEEPLIEYQRGYSDGLAHASGLVRFAPTIIPADEEEETAQAKTDTDMEPVKHAYWVKRMEHGVGRGYEVYTPIWSCSNCGRDYDPASCSIVKYCYICGAKMDGGQKEE